MNKEKLLIAIGEIHKAERYPLEYRIAKYLIQSGYSSKRDNIFKAIEESDPSMSQMQSNKIWNCMRNIEFTDTETHPHHIKNVPDLFESKITLPDVFGDMRKIGFSSDQCSEISDYVEKLFIRI